VGRDINARRSRVPCRNVNAPASRWNGDERDGARRRAIAGRLHARVLLATISAAPALARAQTALIVNGSLAFVGSESNMSMIWYAGATIAPGSSL
jgi:hypothetical protein